MTLTDAQVRLLERAREMEGGIAWALAPDAPDNIKADMQVLFDKGYMRGGWLGGLYITPAGRAALTKAKGESDE